MASVIQLLLNNLDQVSILALFTLGITLTFKTAGVANFAQANVATFGAFFASYLLTRMGVNPWLALVAGIAVCFILGWAADFFIVSRMKSGPMGRIMVTLGLILVVDAFIPIIFGMIPYTYPRYFAGLFHFSIFGTAFTIPQNILFIVVVAVVVLTVTFLALYKTKWGLKMRATASNPIISSMMGVNTKRLTAMSWGVSSAVAALSAILLGSQQSNVSAAMMGSIGTMALLALVVGGITSFYGPIIGAILIPIILTLVAMLSSLWATVMMYSIVLLIILVRPHGLFGKKTMEKI